MTLSEPLLVGAGLLIVALGTAAGAGWAAYFAERRTRETALEIVSNVQQYGSPNEPDEAVVREEKDAEQKALESARTEAIQQAKRWIKREKPNVSDEKAREEAERLIGQGIESVGETVP